MGVGVHVGLVADGLVLDGGIAVVEGGIRGVPATLDSSSVSSASGNQRFPLLESRYGMPLPGCDTWQPSRGHAFG